METNNLNNGTNVCPKTWLVESILATVFCCLPFGIVGIVYAAGVSSKFNAGDIQGAQEASLNAGKWTKISFFVGLAIIAIYVLIGALSGFSALSNL